jgi:hypothetical protein
MAWTPLTMSLSSIPTRMFSLVESVAVLVVEQDVALEVVKRKDTSTETVQPAIPPNAVFGFEPR